VGSADLKAGLL